MALETKTIVLWTLTFLEQCKTVDVNVITLTMTMTMKNSLLDIIIHKCKI